VFSGIVENLGGCGITGIFGLKGFRIDASPLNSYGNEFL
jgi:hypothetical protein